MTGVRRLGHFTAIAVITSLGVYSQPSEDAKGAVACADKGFQTPKCGDCDRMNDYINDAGLIAECHQCCASDGDVMPSKFRSALLEVCKHRIRDTPHIESFIKEGSSKYANLQIRYVYGSPPRLTLRSGKQQETIRIDHWKTENVEEFLNERLIAAASQ